MPLLLPVPILRCLSLFYPLSLSQALEKPVSQDSTFCSNTFHSISLYSFGEPQIFFLIYSEIESKTGIPSQSLKYTE